MTNIADAVVVERLDALARDDAFFAALDRIFFESSATQSFASDEVKAAFRERWLGRYFDYDRDLAFVAVHRPQACPEQLGGYIVGSLDDPARSPRFADLSYFQNFAHVTPQYPAQLHVNLGIDWRGMGIGRRLVATFAAEVFRRGAPGLHAVTSRGMDNIGYYAAIGFHEVASTNWNGRELVMLGRSRGG